MGCQGNLSYGICLALSASEQSNWKVIGKEIVEIFHLG